MWHSRTVAWLQSICLPLLYCLLLFTRSCPTLCGPTDCSMPGFPVLHHLPELAQTHVHWVGDVIQPSRPVALLLLPSIFPGIRVSSNESALRIRWPKCWSFSLSISPSNEYSGLISFRINWFDLVFKKKSFIWLHLVLVAAHKIFSCGI